MACVTGVEPVESGAVEVEAVEVEAVEVEAVEAGVEAWVFKLEAAVQLAIAIPATITPSRICHFRRR